MANPIKISVLSLFLFLLMFGISEAGYSHNNNSYFSKVELYRQTLAKEPHITQLPASFPEHLLSKHKIKVRYKSGESPLVDVALISLCVKAPYIAEVKKYYYTSSVSFTYILATSLRGPPVV